MKTIHQLAKVARRLPRITRLCMTRLVHGQSPGRGPNGQPLPREPLSGFGATLNRSRLAGCAEAAVLLKQELKNRRVGETAFRCALPLKKQHELLATGNSQAAANLLTGRSLMAA